MLVATVCRMTPRLNTHVETMRPIRLPIESDKNGEARAPKNVPADRIETMADSCEGVTFGFPSGSTYPVLKRRCQ